MGKKIEVSEADKPLAPDAKLYHVATVCRRRGTSYTCIRTGVGPKLTTFIPMETLQVTKCDNRDFHDEWEEYTVYEVRRAAELYLAMPFRQIDPKAKALLEAIVVDPTTEYEIEPTQPAKEPTMATKTAAAKKAPAAKKVATAPAPAAKKVGAPAATKAPTKTPVTAKTNPAPKVGAGRAPDDTKYKVIAPDAPRRGETAEYVTEALKLKTFTRQQLIDKMVAAGKDAAKARIKVADMVYFKIVELA